MVHKVARKAASIKDVAALAKVSVPTVSRYMNSREKVSLEKREKIANAITLLGYRPNPIARALVKDQTRSVAVLTTNTTLFGQSQTIEGIEMKSRLAGYSLTITVMADGTAKAAEASVQSCLDQNPAGVILLNFDSISHQAFRYLPKELPSVLIAGDREEETAQISLAERRSGYELTKYLLSLGHDFVTHVAIPGGGGGYSRLAGWREANEELGSPAPAPIEATWDPESGREIGRQLGKDPLVTAVFGGNDELAMGIIRGLNDVGKRVPEDVSVVGFDDHPISKVWNPALTTVRQNFREVGNKSFDLLKMQIDDLAQGRGRTENWSRYVEIPGELVVRESTAAPVAR